MFDSAMLGAILAELKKLNENLENRVTTVTVNVHTDPDMDIRAVAEDIKKTFKGVV